MPLDAPFLDDGQLLCTRSADGAWRVRDCDDGAVRLWRLDAQVADAALADILPGDAAAACRGLLEGAGPGRFARAVVVCGGGRGANAHLDVRAVRIDDGLAVLTFTPRHAPRTADAADTAIAEVTRQLDEAQRTGVLLRAAVEASPVNLTISDARQPDMPLIFVNDAFCKTTGYSRSEVIGRNCRFLQGTDTDPATIERLRAAIREGRSTSVEVLNYRRDGAAFWNYLNVAPVLDPDGAVTAYVGVQHDTTEERRAAETERQRQKLEALGKLAGGVAHEINNLLQPALAFPELIQDALPDGAQEEREWLELIESHALQARGIVGDILAFSRTERGRVAALEATAEIAAALDFVAGLVPASVRVVRAGALAEGHPVGRFMGATSELRQILANLIGNAAHAMGLKGAVTVTLAPTAVGNAIRLDVADSGAGMSAEVRARIFEPFYTTKGVGEGTGLGLSIVYGIVQRWGGDIQVESAPGEGTRFQLTFPRLPDAPPPVPPSAPGCARGAENME
jgi:PAS domain S-box-containing protein